MNSTRGFYLDIYGYLTVDISNPFGFTPKQDSIRIGDEDHTETVANPQLLVISKDSEIL